MSDSLAGSMRERRSKRKERAGVDDSHPPELLTANSRTRRGIETDMQADVEGNTMPLRAITSDTKRWSTRVRVVSKLGIKTAHSSPLKYQKFILADEMGDTIEAMIYNADINLYQDKLEETKAYNILNAQVSRVRDMYKNELISSPYQLTINSSTSIVPVYDGIGHSTPFHPVFLEYDKFIGLLDSKKPICTVCVLLAKRNARKLTVRGQQETIREYAAVGIQMIPFVITFWGNVMSDATYDILDACHRRPVLALLNFIVTGYYGLSLSSTSTSIVLTEMDNDNFIEMRAWREDQMLFIDDTILRGGFFEEKIGHAAGVTVPTTTISEILQSNQVGRFNVRVNGCLDDEAQSFIYMCCEECRFRINVDYNVQFNCNTCQANKVAKPRYRFRLNISDHTGSLDLTIFGKDGEAIIGMPAQEFYDLTIEDEKPPLDSVNSRLKDCVMLIRSSIFNSQQGNDRTSYTLLAMEFVGRKLTLTTARKMKAKKKLDFCPSDPSSEDELFSFTSSASQNTSKKAKIDYTPFERRLMKKGKAKMYEDNVVDEQGALEIPKTMEPSNFSPIVPHDSLSDDGGVTLLDFVQSKKRRQPTKKKRSTRQHLRHEDEVMNEDPRLQTDTPPKNHISRRSSHQTLLDDDISINKCDAGLNIGLAGAAGQGHVDHINDVKMSTKGRMLKRKKKY